jgi:catechol 2,3-dioxygenase-like lactoylglutathione lyase family enzyme
MTMNVEVRGLNHVALVVGDVERSRRFYGGVLEMEEIPRPSNFHFPGAWFRRGSAELHLIGEGSPGRARQLRPDYSPEELEAGYGAHFALEVEDLEPVRREVEERGAEVVGEPRPRGDGVAQMYLRDPDGYLVELMAREDTPGAVEAPIREAVSSEER